MTASRSISFAEGTIVTRRVVALQRDAFYRSPLVGGTSLRAWSLSLRHALDRLDDTTRRHRRSHNECLDLRAFRALTGSEQRRSGMVPTKVGYLTHCIYEDAVSRSF